MTFDFRTRHFQPINESISTQNRARFLFKALQTMEDNENWLLMTRNHYTELNRTTAFLRLSAFLESFLNLLRCFVLVFPHGL